MNRNKILQVLRQKQSQQAKKTYRRNHDLVFGYELVRYPRQVNIQQYKAMRPYILRRVRALVGELIVECLQYDTPIALTGDVMGMHHDVLTQIERDMLQLVLGDIFLVPSWPDPGSEDVLVASRGAVSLYSQRSKANDIEFYLIPRKSGLYL